LEAVEQLEGIAKLFMAEAEADLVIKIIIQ
jgi:hypothetical protein